MRKLFALALIFCVAVPAADAAAKPCQSKRVASLDMLMGPQTYAIFVPVRLNGTSKYLMVDTGGIASTLTPQTASSLSLPTHPSSYQVQNVAGQVLDTVAVVDKFSLAEISRARIEFLLHPENDRAVGLGGDFAGTLAPNILRDYDVEFDFAAAKMNLFTPGSCSSHPYWSPGARSVPMDVLDDGHIVFPMLLDGQRLQAALDTGMSVTTLDLDTARSLYGVDTHSDSVDNIGTLTGDARGAIYRVDLHKLMTEHGEISIDNPRLDLMPDLTRGKRPNGRPQLILGLSMLKQLHVYIAYRDKQIFVTPASGPPAITWHPPEEQSPNTLGSAPSPNEPAPQTPVDTGANRLSH